MFDTHTHLYLPEFDCDRRDVMDRAVNAGVGRMLFPNVDLGTIAPMKSLRSEYPDITLMAMGLHPTEISERWRDDLAVIQDELDRDDYVAVGEIGIDLYWDKTYRKEQMEALACQLDWAVSRQMPVIIHCREGLTETLDVLADFGGKVRGVFHSFGGTVADVEQIRRCGDFYFGINGIVTFKNSGLKDVLPEIGVSRILLETDAPYLAPVPYRGKRNESAYIVNTAQTVALSLSTEVDEVADITTKNAENLFVIRE
ncbi:MAG: TatD family hydrolase [Duncaniella sp.]|nr:TatD family hydrolase [Duncaniella sp.]